jgi:hypothetical protein
MPTETMFRFSTYLSLALACASVGYAEAPVLPEVIVIAAAVIISLIVLFQLETRVELLSIPAANRLGLGLGVANLIWMAARVTWELRSHELSGLPWQLLLAAMFGPLLLSAMPAKLLRREKSASDYWTLHAMGLIAVCLAGAIADDLVAIVLIGLYAVASLWSLCLLHLRQAGGFFPESAPAERGGKPAPIAVLGPTGARYSLASVGVLLALSAALATPIYLLTPNSPAERFSFNGGRIDIGYSHENCNLNQTGELRSNETVAFEVVAEVRGRPWFSLPPEQRWRGRIMREYAHGEWRSGADNTVLPGVDPSPANSGGAWSPPTLGPGQITFTFTVPPRHHAGFLADPVIWARHQPTPIATLKATGPREWTWGHDGQFFQSLDPLDKKHEEPVHYEQVWLPEKDPDLSPPIHIQMSERTHGLTFNPVRRVQEYAETLLNEMVQAGKLPANFRDPVRLLPRPEFHDQIARAFSTHLETSPAFRYSTKLQRQFKDLDPVEEFLFHSKSGHCELFASALTLLLRSEGIPAVLVLGFKGWNPSGEPGKYIVREQNSHAWVAALIQEYEPRTRSDGRFSRWRSLDPSPNSDGDGNSADAAAKSASEFATFNQQMRAFFFTYTSEERQVAIGRLFLQFSDEEILGCIGAVVAMVLCAGLWVRWRRRRLAAAASRGDPWLERLVNRLRVRGLSQAPSETPLEFAARAAEMLRRSPATLPLADIPIDWVEAYYEARFGDRPISQARQFALEERLDEMSRALA